MRQKLRTTLVFLVGLLFLDVIAADCPENTYESSALPENANVIFKPENNGQYFDGTGYEHLSDSTFNVATNGGFTIILKAKASQTASTALRILDFGETSTPWRSVIIARNPSNSFLVTYYDSANGHCGWYGDTDLPLTVDTEHTIVFRLDVSNQIVDVKIDDSLHKTMACSKSWDTVSKTVIGANRNSLSNKWLGYIYYVYVYDRYMDDSAVTSIVAIAENGSRCVPCPTGTFGSPGAVVAFNPSSASEESFTRVALDSKNVGETSWPLQTSSGFTLITKFKFTGTGAWFENVAYFGKDGSIGTIWLRRYGSGDKELLDFRIYQGSSGISTDSKCTIQSAAGSAPQNTVLNIIARWDGSVIELDINGVKGSADCSLVMQNRVLSETYIGSSFIDTSIGGFVDSSRFFLGDMYGMYAWPRHLSDSEAAQVLAGIEIGGPDTLPTLQCTSCPTNGDFVPTCPCPAETHFGSPGAVVAFNPSGNEATFVRSSSQQVDLGTVSYSIQTNGGFTVVAKFMFSGATNGNYERIFGAMHAFDSDVNSFFLGRKWTENALLVQFGDSSGAHCKIEDIVIAQNTQYSAVITYKVSTNTIAVKLNDHSPAYKQCAAGYNLPDFTVSHNKLGAPGYSSTNFFSGTIDGLYVFSRFLEEEQAAEVLAGIEIGGPDTLPTLQCCAADGSYTQECGCSESAFQTTDTPINNRVISFNPAGGVRTFASASDYEDFGDSNRFAIKTNGGMTLLMKFRIHSGITAGGQYPSIFSFKEGAGTGRQNNFYLNIATTMYFTLVKEDISDVYGTTACGMSSLPRPPENEYVDMIVVYDKNAQLFSISFSHINNGVAQTSACPVDLGDRTGRFRFNDNLLGSTEGTGYRGDVAGFYAFDRVLSSADIDTILSGIKTDTVNEDTITVCAACPTDGTYLPECGCPESFEKTLKPVSAEIHMNTGVKKNWDDAFAAAAAAGTRLFTCTELKEYLQQNGPIDAASTSSWVACTGSPSCSGKDFMQAGPSDPPDRITGLLQGADIGWGCLGGTRYDSTQIFMFYVPEKFECAPSVTPGTPSTCCFRTWPDA